MRRHSDSIKKEAIRLRTDLRLPLDKVAELVGVSKSTCSGWLRGYPLTTEEIRLRKQQNGRVSGGK